MKYVVLEVADDWMVDALPSQLPSWYKIVGVFQVPTKYCDPSDGHRGKKTQSGFTRGKKYGWWVCGGCKKPTKGWATNLNALLSSARNLLVENHTLGAAPPSSTAPSEPSESMYSALASPTASSADVTPTVGVALSDIPKGQSGTISLT